MELDQANAIWNSLGDIPMDESGEYIDADFMHFPKGTDKYEIWNYLEDSCEAFSVYDALYKEEAAFKAQP
jgi:hypothetical protein